MKNVRIQCKRSNGAPHHSLSMWEPKGLMEAFLPKKNAQQNFIFLSKVFSYFLFNKNHQWKKRLNKAPTSHYVGAQGVDGRLSYL